MDTQTQAEEKRKKEVMYIVILINKNQKSDILTTKDKAKHKKIIVRIEKKLGTKANKGEPFDKFHARKKKEAKTWKEETFEAHKWSKRRRT